MKRILLSAVAALSALSLYAQQEEVWLFSGQSNMELPISRCMDVVADDVADYTCTDVQYLKVPLTYNFQGPQTQLPQGGRWQTLATPQDAQTWGAFCYYVARYLHEDTGKKITIYNSSVGGSPIEAWIPESFLPSYAQEELAECRDPEWMRATRAHNASLGNWQKAHNALPSNPKAKWVNIDAFSDWGKKGDEIIYGSHLLKNTFRLKASQCKADALLRLGALRDADSTFVNGHYVGNTTYMYPPRKYRVPAEYLKPGKNVVEIHLYATGSQAGFVPEKRYCLETSDGTVQLTEGWQYKEGKQMPRREDQIFLQYKASGLYNAMIAPLSDIGPSIKGVFWYQGESNIDHPDNYGELLKTLIRTWRVLLRNDSLPFYIVELAAFEHSELETAQTSGWVKIQDQQRQVCEEMDNVYLIPNRDLGEWNDIHPQDKKTLGRRAADVVLKK